MTYKNGSGSVWQHCWLIPWLLENWPSKNYKIRVWFPPPPPVFFLSFPIELKLLTIIFLEGWSESFRISRSVVLLKEKTLLSEVQSINGFVLSDIFNDYKQWLNQTTNLPKKTHSFCCLLFLFKWKYRTFVGWDFLDFDAVLAGMKRVYILTFYPKYSPPGVECH